MTERPILFSGPMVKAILEGRKTQTRRLVRLAPSGRVAKGGKNWHLDDPGALQACPFGRAGDRLWVRETWKPVAARPGGMLVRYSADGGSELFVAEAIPAAWAMPQVAARGFVPNIHMPRWACRIVLDVTEVRLQRLWDISEADAKAEGVESEFASERYVRKHGALCGRQHRYGFNEIWEKLHSAASWDANPWVWAVSFRPVG